MLKMLARFWPNGKDKTQMMSLGYGNINALVRELRGRSKGSKNRKHYDYMPISDTELQAIENRMPPSNRHAAIYTYDYFEQADADRRTLLDAYKEARAEIATLRAERDMWREKADCNWRTVLNDRGKFAEERDALKAQLEQANTYLMQLHGEHAALECEGIETARPAIERIAADKMKAACVAKAREWIDSPSCKQHDENPCCHIRTATGIADALEALLLDNNEAQKVEERE